MSGHKRSIYDPHRQIRLIDTSATDLRDPIDRSRCMSSGGSAITGLRAATVLEVGSSADLGAMCGRTSQNSISSESTIRSGGSPGTKQIETSFCGVRPIGSLSSFDNCERETNSCIGMKSDPFGDAVVPPGVVPPGRDTNVVRKKA